ncbi:uncharacterized protein LOC108679103 [Hyalella azteca]|uniref:Uncharacterized protein LOC108679103 n=1 Tax=Hyalella azteca TaxID=294128 RepID=A0A8B7PBP3_HYAAZ|nr:uncharacterized protein LOC108679103 [Hyalella azteca]
MKRRKPALRPGDPRWPSVLSIVHAPFGLFLLVALLVLSLVVGRASTSAIHLINSGNFTNRARECGRDRKPLLQLQSFFLDQVHRNASTATSLCHNPDLLDAVVGCGNSANDAVKSRLTNFCRASSFAAGQPQIRTRRRTVSPAGTHFKKAITRENDKTRGLTSAPAKRRTRPENSKPSSIPGMTELPLRVQKKYKRINNLMAKTTCKPRKMILPILDVANLSENEKSVYTHSYHLEPCMVEVTRCGGCCTNDLLECSPTKIRTKKIPFLKLESSNGESTANEDNTVD